MLSPILLFSILSPAPQSELLGFVFNRLNLLFGFGFLVSLAYLRRPDWFVAAVPNGMTILTGLCGLYLLLCLLISYTHLATVDVLLTGTGASLILCVALRVRAAPAPGLIDRVGLARGDASYAIYLTHGAVISAILGVWSRVAPASSTPVVALVCIAGSLGAGILVHRTIERPMVRRLQDFRFRPRVRATPTLMGDTTSKLG
jgi:peptidoglycan/LPS O-acetylase OafA/YrhL